jgi:signal transduction histidine kinase
VTGKAITWKPLAIVTGLGLLLTYLLSESRIPAQAPRARMQEALQALQLHDAELNRDVLMARAGLLPNYDSLAQIGHSLFRDLAVLRAESETLTDDAAMSIKQEVEVLAPVLQQKLTLVEYLKSDNALLRNSLAYFLQTIRSLDVRDELGKSAVEIAALSHLILRFVQMPETNTREEFEATLTRLSAAPLQQQEVALLSVHGRLIVELVPQLDTLVHEILTAPTTSHAEALQGALLAYADQAEVRAQYFRLLLYLAAVTLLVYLLHLFVRLRTNARELRRQEIQLIQANKMTSLGVLVSGVAHEINNPNQVILMNSSMAAAAWTDALEMLDVRRREEGEFCLGGLPYTEMRDTLPQLIQDIHDSARRIERIISDLKDFARPGARGTRTTFELNEVVQQALRLLAHLIHKRTDHFRVVLADGLPSLRGDAQQVEQIVVNLVINALESLPDRKRGVTVTTSRDDARRSVVLEVKDEGAGIPSEHIPRLGEPFFTTKQTSGGTGLGLAITSSLVRLHKGRLSFASEPRKGARVTVEFPCLQPERHMPELAAG